MGKYLDLKAKKTYAKPMKMLIKRKIIAAKDLMPVRSLNTS